eukprot:gene3583-7122_t
MYTTPIYSTVPGNVVRSDGFPGVHFQQQQQQQPHHDLYHILQQLQQQGSMPTMMSQPIRADYGFPPQLVQYQQPVQDLHQHMQPSQGHLMGPNPLPYDQRNHNGQNYSMAQMQNPIALRVVNAQPQVSYQPVLSNYCTEGNNYATIPINNEQYYQSLPQRNSNAIMVSPSHPMERMIPNGGNGFPHQGSMGPIGQEGMYTQQQFPTQINHRGNVLTSDFPVAHNNNNSSNTNDNSRRQQDIQMRNGVSPSYQGRGSGDSRQEHSNNTDRLVYGSPSHPGRGNGDNREEHSHNRGIRRPEWIPQPIHPGGDRGDGRGRGQGRGSKPNREVRMDGERRDRDRGNGRGSGRGRERVALPWRPAHERSVSRGRTRVLSRRGPPTDSGYHNTDNGTGHGHVHVHGNRRGDDRRDILRPAQRRDNNLYNRRGNNNNNSNTNMSIYRRQEENRSRRDGMSVSGRGRGRGGRDAGGVGGRQQQSVRSALGLRREQGTGVTSNQTQNQRPTSSSSNRPITSTSTSGGAAAVSNQRGSNRSRPVRLRSRGGGGGTSDSRGTGTATGAGTGTGRSTTIDADIVDWALDCPEPGGGRSTTRSQPADRTTVRVSALAGGVGRRQGARSVNVASPVNKSSSSETTTTTTDTRVFTLDGVAGTKRRRKNWEIEKEYEMKKLKEVQAVTSGGRGRRKV